ncbi:family 16 glycoside hydrolase [Telluribacter humicola]|uniref:family 16 glycoside hydrolase n=1 Tax=Telluribacter humicola TaxID=1720261 RepID=UPI001A95E0CA|nr:family 16 glycoside hydrolase [Telluribacter humicola]
MRSLTRIIYLLLLTCPLFVSAQSEQGNYTAISLKDLSAFGQTGSNWSVKGGVTIHPDNASSVKTQSGSGVLVGTPGSPLTTQVKAQDLQLRLEFMLSPGAEGYVHLPGGQRVRLADSRQQPTPNAQSSGFISQFPAQNAAKAPGLWQTLELAYDASVPTQAGSALLNNLALNGVTVQQSVYLPLSKSIAEPQALGLEVTKGTIAFRNIGYQLLGDRKPLALQNMSYKLYNDSWNNPKPVKVVREEKTNTLTQEIGTGMREFHAIYEGEMNVEESGIYIFTVAYTGPILTLDIDGKQVIAPGESTSQDLHSGSIQLNKGAHKFRLHYSRFPWRPAALGLRVETAGVRPYDLHPLSSLPVPAPKPYMGVAAEGRPEMIRSFVQLEDEKYKRTHCVSVGSPAGWHYTMDLNRGALLQAWRGQFANVTEMWYERGEPQLLFTAGLTVPVSGKSSIAILKKDNTAWPDSADINFLGYRLDAQGFPMMRYAAGSATVNDYLVPGTDGLVRTINVDGTPNGGTLYTLAGAGKQIEMVEKGLYKIDNHYYVRLDKRSKAVLRTSGGQQELLLPVNGSTSYTMFW